MTGSTDSKIEEVQPLRNGHSCTPDSINSTFSSVSRRKPDYTRWCLVALLLCVVLLMAVVLSFLIGHWLSEDSVNAQKRDQLMKQLTPQIPTDPSSSEEESELTTLLMSASTSEPYHVERILPLTEQLPKPFTLRDVFPPSNDLVDELHASRRTLGAESDSLLVALPLHILPLHYSLSFDLSSFEERKIQGRVAVLLESFGNSTDDEIQFHAASIVDIERIRITKDGRRIHPKAVKREENKKLCRVILREQLHRGKYLLEMDYNTTICGEESGGVHCFFENSKPDENSKVASFTTKFEPTLARTFFPCWDEPGIKATFNITVTHHSRYVVLSNMPRKRSEENSSEGIVITTFEETPQMSTYLVALAVGEFIPMEMRSSRDLPFTIWTHREDLLAAQFAANFSPVMFDKLEEELDVPYPLPKLDLVAARSFPVGGMENWGLIVFDYQSLLLDHSLLEDHVNMTVDRLYQEYKIEKLITHELAHQWFGNLATMRNWEDVWLNEGFATFLVLDVLKNEKPVLTENEYYARLAHLANKQSGEERYALVREHSTENSVEEAFHAVHLYVKGGVLVRMIRDLVSDVDFKDGIKRYLRKNAFRSVSRDELWKALPAQADYGADRNLLSAVMEPWLVNEGLPVVTITRHYHGDMITVTQAQAHEHDYKEFMKENKTEAIVRWRRNADVEETTPFDESLFEGYVGKSDHPNKRRHKKKKRKPTIVRNEDPRFLLEELSRPRRTSVPSDLWTIPFSYMFGSLKSMEGQVVREFWLRNRSLTFADVELASSQPVIANPHWAFPYRVNYDMTNWRMIAKQLHLNHKEIPPKSRMQIIVDAETFLSYSEQPELYLYLIGYLAKETDLGVALLGLDAVYRLLDTWRGSNLLNSMLLYISPVIAQFDELLQTSQADTEQAALWLIEPTRLSKLYQLRCNVNLGSCNPEMQTANWLAYPASGPDDVHRQATAVCHFLFTNKAEKEVSVLESRLRSRGTQWTTAVQLAACSRDDRIARLAAKQIVATKNAAVLASGLQSDFGLQYNRKFRSALWHMISRMSNDERVLLFSCNETLPRPASRILVHSIRSHEELRLLQKAVPYWSEAMKKHVEYVEKELNWMADMSDGTLGTFFRGGIVF